MKIFLVFSTVLMIVGLVSGCGKSEGVAPSSSIAAPTPSPEPPATPGQLNFAVGSYDYGSVAGGQIATVTLQVTQYG